MYVIRRLCFAFLFISFTPSVSAASLAEIVAEKIAEPHTFYGLASYYNNVNYFLVNKESIQKLDDDEVFSLGQDQWLAAVGRFDVLLIQAQGLSLGLDGNALVVENSELLNASDASIQIVSKPELAKLAPELDQIRYAHLWQPLAWLSKLVERSLLVIQANIVSNWGIAVVVFAVLLKLILLPASIMTVRFQRKVSQVQATLAPQLAEIKAKYDGEEAHNRLMAAHKTLGVSPFYTLKPMLASLIQIPILIAVFNALGEMPQFNGQSFLWIENLAYPDALATFSVSLPMFGNTLNTLPFVMTLVTVFSTIIFQNRHAREKELKSQKRNLYLMAVAFFVLFYPFPAVMVLYWALANLLQAIQQQLIKI